MKKYKGVWKPEKAKPVKNGQPLDLRSLWIGGKVDFEGEVAIEIAENAAWIDEDRAKQIIKHLENVFNIKQLARARKYADYLHCSERNNKQKK